MVELEFNFSQVKTIIQANLDDLFNTAIRKYCDKAHIKKETVFFMAEGTILQEDKKIKDLMNEISKREKKMYI